MERKPFYPSASSTMSSTTDGDTNQARPGYCLGTLDDLVYEILREQAKS